MSTFAPHWWNKPPAILGYVAAVLAVAAVVLVNIVLDRFAGVSSSLSVFLCAIMFVAWAHGTAPALFTVVLSVLAFNYFFLAPIDTFHLEFRDAARLGLFIVAALLVISLVAAQRRTADSLRRSERDLTEAKLELQQMIDTIPVFIATYRPDGTRSFVNQSWQDYMGLTLEQARGKDFPHFHPDDAQQQGWRAALASGQPFHTEIRVRRHDGQYRWHNSHRVPLRDEHGAIIRWYSVGIDIEDRKQAELAVRESEARLREAQRELQRTIDTIPVMVAAYRADGTRTFINKMWQDYSGLTPEEVVGGSTMLLVHPDEFEAAERAWRAALAAGKPLSIEARVRRADGEFRWQIIRRLPLRNENGEVVRWYGVSHDIDDQKQAESALRQSEAQLADAERELRLTLDSIPTLAWRARTDGSAEYLNKRWLDYAGITLEQGLGWAWTAVLHPDDVPGLQSIWQEMLASQQRGEAEARMRRFDGTYRWFLFRAEPLRDAAGIVTGWYGTNVDVEDRKRAEAALHAAEAALAHASHAATLGEVSATIAHEVSQPLSAILINAKTGLRLLQNEAPDLNGLRAVVESIAQDGNRASEVVRRVRALLKADADKAPTDINATIDEVVALLQRELAAKNVALRKELAPGLPLAVADRVQLQQVIINLVMNGIQAMEAVTDRPRALVIQSRQNEAGELVVAVQDSGVGIPAEIRDRLFDAFFSTKPNGLGMGLSICRSIIDDHGGRMSAANNGAAPGATFQFSLPARRSKS